MPICTCKPNRRSKRCTAHMGFTQSKPSVSFKAMVLSSGVFALDYSEVMRNAGEPAYFVGRGRVAGNTSAIPSGLHSTPRAAWKAAAMKLHLLS